MKVLTMLALLVLGLVGLEFGAFLVYRRFFTATSELEDFAYSGFAGLFLVLGIIALGLLYQEVFGKKHKR
jgi:hypothetical protein